MKDSIITAANAATRPPVREIQPSRQATPPKFIKVVITEEDRQKADSYCCIKSCLACTVLRRAGLDVDSVDPENIYLRDGTRYRFDLRCGFDDYLECQHSGLKPFYAPSVVGKVISCTLVESPVPDA